MTEIDFFLKELEKSIKERKKVYYKKQSNLPESNSIYEKVLKSKEATREMKGIALLLRRNDYAGLGDLASEIAILYTIKMLAISVKILEIKIDSIIEAIANSKILEKAKDIDDIKKLKSILKQQIEKTKKKRRETEEKRRRMEKNLKEDLSYIS